MERVFDSRYKINIDSSVQNNIKVNLYLVKVYIFVVVLYALSFISWTVFSIVLSIIVTVNVFFQLDIRRNIKIYSREYFNWESKSRV